MPTATAAVPLRTIAVSLGETRAVLSYFRYPADYGRRGPRLTIVRDATRFSENIAPNPRDHVGRTGRAIVDDVAVSGDAARPLIVRDLDGDGEPEVAAMLFWGGTRCCFWSRVYRFDRVEHRYVPSSHFWGNNQDKPVLRDLDGDGSPEYLARDGRIEALSATYAYIDPIQIWSYRRGAFADVTRRFPGLIRSDARKLWRGYARAAPGDGVGARLYLAAWAGDEYRLHERRAADAAIKRALRSGRLDIPKSEHLPTSRRWVAALQTFLRRNGY